MPDASHLSFIYVYRIEAFFLNHFIRKLISYYNTRALLMVCRSRPAFEHCTVLLWVALCSIYVRNSSLTVGLSAEACKANSSTFAIVRVEQS